MRHSVSPTSTRTVLGIAIRVVLDPIIGVK